MYLLSWLHVPVHINFQLLYVHYLKHCWQWPYYGATFYEGSLITKNSKLSSSVRPITWFWCLILTSCQYDVCVNLYVQSPSKLSRKSHVPVSIGINTQGFHIVDQENKVGMVWLVWCVRYVRFLLEALLNENSLTWSSNHHGNYLASEMKTLCCVLHWWYWNALSLFLYFCLVTPSTSLCGFLKFILCYVKCYM